MLASPGRPIEVTKDGEKLHVVLLDSEGMGRPGAEAEHDARVFSLAALLSSLLVYNWFVVGCSHPPCSPVLTLAMVLAAAWLKSTTRPSST